MSSPTVFKNLILNGKIVDIICESGKIVSIGRTDTDGVDFFGKKVYAGLVDIHTHGMGGVDVMDGNICLLAHIYAKNGTTAFMPTTMSADMNTIIKILTMDAHRRDGADVVGYHLEGPYIHSDYVGAQNPTFIRNPDLDEFKEYKNVGMITIAPELEGAMELIQKANAVVSLGHTSADYETTLQAAKHGAKCLTHTFNAMKPIHHRMPGPIGAAYDADMYIQVICDGIHVHPTVIRMLYRLFGADRMILISDSMRATGLPDGEYELGGQMMTLCNGIARTSKGALAGSTSTLFECVRRAIEFGIPEKDAFKMAAETPAQLLGIKKGRIQPGYDCDLIILDKNGFLDTVIVKGMICTTKQDGPIEVLIHEQRESDK